MDSDSTSFAALPLKDDSRKDSRVQLCHIKGQLTAPVRCPCYPGLKRLISDRREGKSTRAGGTEETARARTHTLLEERSTRIHSAFSARCKRSTCVLDQKICEHHWPIPSLFNTRTHRSTHKCRASAAYSRAVVRCWFTMISLL